MKEILNFQISFAEHLKELIADKNWNMKILSEKIGITRSTINDWILMRKIPKADSLLIIAEFFDISIDELLGRTDFIKNKK